MDSEATTIHETRTRKSEELTVRYALNLLMVGLVLTAGFVGEHMSIGVDSLGHAHIVYFEGNDYDLKYARFDGATWVLEVVDSAGTTGYEADLALDANNLPHISYRSNSGQGVRYAHHDGTAWVLEVVDPESMASRYSSIAVDSLGWPHISYATDMGGHLRYAQWDGTAWTIETVDNSGDVEHESSIALDALDQPHISYHDRTNYDLKYAYWNGTDWHLQTVATTGDMGYYNALVLDATGHTHHQLLRLYQLQPDGDTTELPVSESHHLEYAGRLEQLIDVHGVVRVELVPYQRKGLCVEARLADGGGEHSQKQGLEGRRVEELCSGEPSDVLGVLGDVPEQLHDGEVFWTRSEHADMGG